MENRQIDRNATKQVRIDSELHRMLKITASKLSLSIKELLEGYIAEGLGEEAMKNSS